MKIIKTGLNTFEDSETKTKFILLNFQGEISAQQAENHIEKFRQQRIEVLLANHFNGKTFEVLCGELPKTAS